MKVSDSHGRVVRRLTKYWKAELRKDPAALHGAKTLPKGPRQQGESPVLQVVGRLVIWMAAFVSFPQGLAFFAIVSAAVTIWRASIETNRGPQEMVLNLYGGADRDLVSFFRMAMRRTAWLSALDAAVVFGLWCFLGRMPAWVAVLGVPCYVAGSVAGVVLLAALVPRPVLAVGSFVGYMAVPLCVPFLSGGKMPADVALNVMWLSGALVPAGWVLLMVHELLAGKYLLAGVVPLLGAAVWLGLGMARGLERRLFQHIFNNEPVESGPEFPESDDGTSGDQEFPMGDQAGEDTGERAPAFREALETMRRRHFMDYGWETPAVPVLTTRVMRMVLVCFFFAVLIRFQAPIGAMLGFLFGGSLMLVLASVMDVRGAVAWAANIQISTNQITPLYALYPVSLRKVLATTIRRDLSRVLRGLPTGFLIAIGAFAIAAPFNYPGTLCCAVVVTLFVLLKFPLRWCHIVNGRAALASMPGGLFLKWTFLIVVVVIGLIEVVGAIVLCYLVFEMQGLQPAGLLFGAAALVVAGMANAALGLAGALFGLWAYESGRVDVVGPLEQK